MVSDYEKKLPNLVVNFFFFTSPTTFTTEMIKYKGAPI